MLRALRCFSRFAATLQLPKTTKILTRDRSDRPVVSNRSLDNFNVSNSEVISVLSADQTQL